MLRRATLQHIIHWQHRKWTTIARAKMDQISVATGGGRVRRSLLFYPALPLPYTAIYKICHLANCRMVSGLSAKFDRAIYWEDKTFRHPDAFVAKLNIDGRVINGSCVDISKTKVAAVFEQTFGYALAIDPQTFKGSAVCKADANAAHNGRVVKCPVDRVEPGCVYQIIINNTVGDEVEDIRVAVVKDAMPLAYIKRRSKNDRFSNTNTSASVQATASLLSQSERTLLLTFCRAMGLDYGEVDTLRDRDNGRLYVVDVNSTPFGPPNHLPKSEGRRAMKLLSEVFCEQFFGDQPAA